MVLQLQIKQTNAMNEKEFIKRFTSELVIEEIDKNHKRYSCLMLALTDARKLTARDQKTGKPNYDLLENEKSFFDPNSFICLINYLLILDLIGEVFVKGKDKNIMKALSKFGAEISKEDKYAIKALRNSFAHNYGLINISKNKEFCHKFILEFSENSLIIKHPEIEWDGIFNKTKSDVTSTTIYVKNLIDYIEDIWKKLNTEIDGETIDIVLDDRIEELKSRFTVIR